MTVRLLDVPQGSPAWLAARRQRYGASELAPIGGVESYQTAADVWRSKLGHPRERGADLWLRIGHALEPLALELAREALGPTTLRGAVLFQDRGWLLASLDDALDMPAPEPIDAKVRGAGSPDWTLYQDEAIPFSTQLQLLQQAALIAELTGTWPEAAHVSALLGDRYGWTHRLYRLALTPERLDLWRDVWAPYPGRWHRRYVEGREPPPDATMADVAVLVEPVRVQQREATPDEAALLVALVEAEAARKEAARLTREALAARDAARDALALSLGPDAVVPGVRWASRRNLTPILKLETAT